MGHETTLKVLELRQENSGLRGVRIAEILGVSRQRVWQILKKATLATNIPNAPAMHQGCTPHPSRYVAAPISHPPATPTLIVPPACPKCKSGLLYIDYTPDGPEVWCLCGNMVAFILDRRYDRRVTCPT